MKSSKVRKLILFCFGLLFFSILISRVDIHEIIKIIAGAKLYYIILGVLVYLALIFTRSFKWFLLARVIGNKIKYKEFVPFYLTNSLMGSLTPFKSGEAATPFLFKKYLKIPVGQGFSIVILDRFFELAIFTIILVFAVFYILNQGIQSGLISSFFRGVLIVLFLILICLVIAMVSKRITIKIVRFFRVSRFVEKDLVIFYSTLSLFKNKKAYLFLTSLTSLCWFFEVLAPYLVYGSFFSAPFISVAVAIIVAGAATFVTFIPQGMGVFEVGVVYLLNLFGYPTVLVTSGVLVARVFLTGTLLTSGLLGLIRVNYLKKDFITDHPASKE